MGVYLFVGGEWGPSGGGVSGGMSHSWGRSLPRMSIG